MHNDQMLYEVCVRLIDRVRRGAGVERQPPERGAMAVSVTTTSVLVDDQAEAQGFPTRVVGFVKKTDTPVGGFRWPQVVGSDTPDGAEFLREPDEHPAATAFTAVLVEESIPSTSFGADNVNMDCERLVARGVGLAQPATVVGSVTTAMLDDACRNSIRIVSRS